MNAAQQNSLQDRVGTFVRIRVSSTQHQVGIVDQVDPQTGVVTVSTSSGFALSAPIAEVRRALLIIVDLNGVLAARTGRSILKRPFVDDFLAFLFRNFVVAVWTSSQEHNGRRIIEEVFGPRYTPRLCFAWFRDKCTPNTTSTYGTIKDLAHVFAAFGRSFDASNTIIVDDSPEKCSHPLNSLCPPQFTNDTAEDAAAAASDRGLNDTMKILSKVLECDSLAPLLEQSQVFGPLKNKPKPLQGDVAPPAMPSTMPPLAVAQQQPQAQQQVPTVTAVTAPPHHRGEAAGSSDGTSPVVQQQLAQLAAAHTQALVAAYAQQQQALPPRANPSPPVIDHGAAGVAQPQQQHGHHGLPVPRSQQQQQQQQGSNRNSPSVDLSRAVGSFPTTPVTANAASIASASVHVTGGNGGIDVASALLGKLGKLGSSPVVVQRSSPSSNAASVSAFGDSGQMHVAGPSGPVPVQQHQPSQQFHHGSGGGSSYPGTNGSVRKGQSPPSTQGVPFSGNVSDLLAKFGSKTA